jgi:hypothetical protein
MPKMPFGKTSVAKVYSSFHRALHEVDDVLLEFRRPQLRLLLLDGVDHIHAEVQVLRLVAHDVLDLLSGTRELVLALEAEHDREGGVEEDAFHDEREDDHVLEELLIVLEGARLEIRGQRCLRSRSTMLSLL